MRLSKRFISRTLTIMQAAIVLFSLMAFIDLRHNVSNMATSVQRFNAFVVGDCKFQDQRTGHGLGFLEKQALEYDQMAVRAQSDVLRSHYRIMAKLMRDRENQLQTDPYLYGCGPAPAVPQATVPAILSQ